MSVIVLSTILAVGVKRPGSVALARGCRAGRQPTHSVAMIGRFALHVILPTFVGVSVYLLFRTPSLLVFQWVEAIGLRAHLMALRDCLSDVQLPEWFLYSLPDGIWAYATTMWMVIIWRGARPWPWLSIGVLIAVGAEFGQAVGCVPGTYQHLDVLFCVGAFLLALLQMRWANEASLTLSGGTSRDDPSCLR